MIYKTIPNQLIRLLCHPSTIIQDNNLLIQIAMLFTMNEFELILYKHLMSCFDIK